MIHESLYYTALYGEIATFEHFTPHISVISQFIDSFMETIILPLKLRKGLKLYTDFDGVDKFRWFSSLDETIELLESRPDELTLAKLHKNDDIKVYLSISKWNRLPESATIITYGVCSSLLSGKNLNQTANYFVETTEWLMTALNGVSGYVTHDYLMHGHPTPQESEIKDIESVTWLSINFDKYFRGYFWGNFLGPGLVRHLGSVEDILKGAPVYQAKKLANEGVYLQLSEEIDSITPEAFEKLRSFLLPILPPKMRGTKLYVPGTLMDSSHL